MAATPRFMFQRFGRRVVAVPVEFVPRVQRWCEPCEVGWVGDTTCWSCGRPAPPRADAFGGEDG